MRVTVVGGGSGREVGGEVNAGYLATSGEASLLMDCGYGVATRLAKYTRLADLAGVVVTHMDLNHYFDLVPLANILANHYYDMLMRDRAGVIGGERFPPLPVYFPPGGAAWFDRLLAFLGEGGATPSPTMTARMRAALTLRDYPPHAPFAVGLFTVVAVGPVAHAPGRCFGFRVTDGEAVVGYTGDSGPCDALYDIARDTDLFLCDAMDLASQIRTDGRHLSAEEAGRVAAVAGARHLVLTHLASNTRAWMNSLTQTARRHYAGPVSVAREEKAFDIPPLTNP